tara:strand:- start:2326 stop:2520 length:195 start_codon:yes stop_codon:yes gene_type:complete
MKVTIIKTCAAGDLHLEAGETCDVSDAMAKDLIKFGRATEAIEAPSCPPKPKAKKKVATTNGSK